MRSAQAADPPPTRPARGALVVARPTSSPSRLATVELDHLRRWAIDGRLTHLLELLGQAVLHALEEVTIDPQRDRRIGVPEAVGNRQRARTRFDEHRRVRVPKVVGPQLWGEAGRLEGRDHDPFAE